MGTLAKAFIHPEDRSALDQLEAIPLFPQFVKGFLKVFNEQLMHGINMANKVRLGPDQLPKIYNYLPPIAESLKIAEPEFYLEMDPNPNAYTMGDSRIFVVVTSGLLQLLEDDEIRAVIAHECGHIACRHTLYRTIALLLASGADILGALMSMAVPLQIPLNYWMRRSELSADRASAFVMRDPKPMMKSMVRFSGGPKSITADINFDRYMQQAESYDTLIESKWDKVLQGFAVMGNQHPFNTRRCRELKAWTESAEFSNLLRVLELSESGTRCSNCSNLIEPAWQFCKHCGKRLATSA